MRVQKGSHTHFGKRALALFLSLVMCISMVQISAFATAEFDSSQQIEKTTVGEEPNQETKPVYYTYNGSEFVRTDDNAVDTQPIVTNTGDDNWKVKLSKQISGTNEENKFRIDLTVETKQRIETVSEMPDSAVALVIDISSSMRECIHCGQKENERNHTGTTKLMCPDLKDKEYKGDDDDDDDDECERDKCGKKKSEHRVVVTSPATCTIYKSKLQQAKEAAISFAAKFAASGMDEKGNRIAARWMSLAAFDANASQKYGWVDTTRLTWTKDADGSYYDSDNVLANAIRDLKPGIGTNIAGGLSVGSALLNSTPKTADDKAIESKFVLLLGDGEPYGEQTACPYNVADYNTAKGTNTENGHMYTPTEKWARYIRETQGAKLFSVYVQHNASTDNNTYKWFQAFSNSASLAANADSLVESFDRYLTLITIGAEAWVVSDKMGQDIQYVEKADGEDNYNKPTQENGNVLTWTLRNDMPVVTDLSTGKVIEDIKDLKDLDEEGDYTFAYHFAYKIRLNVTEATAPTEHLTNGRTFLTYYLTDGDGNFIDKDGEPATGEDAKLYLDFKVPAVVPLTAELYVDKYATWNQELIGDYNKDNAFKLTMLDDAGNLTDNKYFGTAKDGIVSFTNIPSHHEYLLEEYTKPDGYELSTDKYYVTIEGGKITEIRAADSNRGANKNVQRDGKHLKFFDELDPKNTTIQITKKWAGNHIPGDLESLTVTLKAKVNGEFVPAKNKTVTLSAPSWTNTITVPTMDVETNQHITYEVEEPESDAYDLIGVTGGYKLNQVDSNGIDKYDPIELTNTATGDVPIKKDWVGDASVDSVTIKVYVGKTFKQAVTLNAPSWTSSAKLPLYDASGDKIQYNFKEVDQNGKEIAAGGTVELNGKFYTMTAEGNTIKNTIQQKPVTLTVNKTWKVGGEDYTAEFELLADGKATGIKKTITSSESVVTFAKLPKYAVTHTANDAWVDYSDWGLTLNGHEISYTLEETVKDAEGKTVTNVTGAITTAKAEDANGNYSIGITNTRQENKTVTLTKEFVDRGYEEYRPQTITLRLTGNGKTYDVDLSNFYEFEEVDNGDGTTILEKSWLDRDSGTVTVPLYDADGKPIIYTFSEVGTDANGILKADGVEYAMTVKDGSSLDNGFTAINTLRGGEISIRVQKIWVDDKTDATRTASTTISVMKDGAVAAGVNGEDCTWPTSKDGTATFTVPRFENGAAIRYTVEETAVPGYNNGQPATATLAADGTYVFTNVISDKDATVSISGTKDWKGGDASFRPTVTLTLWKNGVETAQTTTLAADNTFSFTGLPKYTVTGNRCQLNTYAVAESMSGDAAAYYAAKDGASKKDVTWNATHDAGTVAFTNVFNSMGPNGGKEIGGSKIWVDGSATHTETITVGLWNGTEIVDTKQISSANDYTFKFTGLDEVDSKGNEIIYTVYEMDDTTPVGMDQDGNRTNDGKITIGGNSYDVSYKDTAIYNTRAQDSKTLNVTKYWYGPTNPISFTVYVKDTDTVAGHLTMAEGDENTSVDGNKWTASITLDKYDAKRNEIHYEIREDGVDANGLVTFDGSSYTYKSQALAGNVFVNTVQQVNDVTVKVTKDWKDTDLAVSSQPEKISVYLLRDTGIYDKNGDGKIDTGDTYQLTETENWTLTISQLPRFKDNNSGEESVYSIQEVGYDQTSGTVKHGSDYYKAEVTQGAASTDADFHLILTNTCLGHYAYIINRYYTYTDSSGEKTQWTESTGMTYGVKDEQVTYNAGDYVKPTTKHTGITFGFDGGTEKNEQHDASTIDAGDVTDKVMTLDNMDLFIVDLYYSKTETYVPPVNPPKDDGRKPSKPSKPPVVIEDPEVPLTPMPEEPEIEIPEVEIPEVEIPEEDVPLAEIPETGDTSAMWILAAAVSGIGLVWLSLTGKKRKEESAE